MASRYWVGGGSSTNWSATGNTNWSASSGGANDASVPGASDDVIFDASSGSGVSNISSSSIIKSLNMTGFTGTLSGSSQVNIRGDCTFGTGMTLNWTGFLLMDGATTTVDVTLTMNGQTRNGSTSLWPGAGKSATLGDDLNIGTSSFFAANGETGSTTNLSGKTITCGGFSINASANIRTITMGTTIINSSGSVDFSGNTNLTLDATTVTLNMSSSVAVNFKTGGFTFSTVNFNGSTPSIIVTGNFVASSCTITGAGTITMSGNSSWNVTTLTANSSIVQWTGASNVTVTSNGQSFYDLTINKTAATSLTASDALVCSHTLTLTQGTFDANNKNISCLTFSSSNSNTRTLTMGSGTWTVSGTGTAWTTDTTTGLTFNTNTSVLAFSGSSQTFTTGGLTFATVNFTATTPNATITGTFTATACTITGTGTLALSSSWNVTTFTANSSTVTFSGSSLNITSNSQSFYKLTINMTAGQTVTPQDAVTCSNALTLTQGTFTANNFNITCLTFSSNNSNTRVITMGTGTWLLTGTGTVWDTATITGLTVTQGTSTIKINDASSTVKTFSGGGKTYYNIWFTGAGTGTFDIVGSNTFNDFKVDTPPHTIRFTAATTTTVTTFTVNGTAGNLMTIGSITSASHTLTKSGGGTITCDYMSISYSTATPASTWDAGEHSTNGGNNSGWRFWFVTAGNVYTSNNVYAECTATSGDLTVALSKDGGVNYQSALTKTFGAAETTETYGTGSTELWGSTFTGDDVDDTSFRLKVYQGDTAQVYKTFGFAITSTFILTGIEVTIEGKYTSADSKIYIDQILVKIYYGTSTFPVQNGSVAYASDGRRAGEGAGLGTGVLVFYANANWKAVDTGATVAA